MPEWRTKMHVKDASRRFSDGISMADREVVKLEAIKDATLSVARSSEKLFLCVCDRQSGAPAAKAQSTQSKHPRHNLNNLIPSLPKMVDSVVSTDAKLFWKD